MLNSQVHQTVNSSPTSSSLLNKSSFLSPTHHESSSSIPLRPWSIFGRRLSGGRVKSVSNNIRASVAKSITQEKFVKVKGIVTSRLTITGSLTNLGLNRALDDLTDVAKKTLLIELVSSELDPKTGEEQEPIKDFAHWIGQDMAQVRYECEFMVPVSFGQIGAVLVENQHHREMFLKDIVFNGFPNGPLHINCESWVHSKFNNQDKRIFFSNKLGVQRKFQNII